MKVEVLRSAEVSGPGGTLRMRECPGLDVLHLTIEGGGATASLVLDAEGIETLRTLIRDTRGWNGDVDVLRVRSKPVAPVLRDGDESLHSPERL